VKKRLAMFLATIFLINTISIVKPVKAQESSNLPVWVPTNIEKVLRDQEFPANGDTSIKMYSAKNEYEGAQVIIKADENGLKNVKVNVTDLKHSNGSDIMTKDSIKIYKEHYMNVTEPTAPELKAGWYPDALIPLTKEFDVEASQNQGIWITVNVPKGQAAGTYTGKVEIQSEGKSTNVPIEFNVWDFELPDEKSTKTAFAIWFNQVANYYGLQYGTKEYWDMQEKYYWFQNEYGAAPQDLPIPSENVDEYVEGVKRFNSNPKVSGFRLPFYDKKDENGNTVIDWDKNKELVDKLRAQNLLGKAYYYVGGWIDEPTGDKFPLVREICQKLKEIAPEVRHVVTREPVKALWGSVDTWAPILYYYDRTTAHNRQALGEHVWWYTCVNPKHPYPSYHIDDDLLGARLLTWMQKDNDVEGNLYWATTIFQKYDLKQGKYVERDVWNDPKAFPGANGDGFLLYPGKAEDVGFDGPVGTIRLEAIRDGLEDYEYLVMLEKKIQDKITELGIGDQVKAADVMQYFYDQLYEQIDKYDNEPQKLIEMRKLVADQILNISGNNSLLTIKKVNVGTEEAVKYSETEREVNVYAAKGSLVKINNEAVEGTNINEKTDKFTEKLNLNSGENVVNVAIENGGKSDTIQRTVKVKTSTENKEYEIPMFEIKDQEQLDKMNKIDAKLELSEEYAAPGKKSILATFGEKEGWPGFEIDLDEMGITSKDWTKYKAVDIDVFNPDPDNAQWLFSKLFDAKGNSDDSSSIKINPYTKATFRISMEKIKENGKIDLSDMGTMSLQTWQAGEFKLYISNIRFVTDKNPDGKELFSTNILDFENKSDVDNLTTNGTEVSMSEENATKGTSSLKVHYKPEAAWPWFRVIADKLSLGSNDWTKFKTLEFDVYNPDQDQVQGIYVKFFDNGSGSDDSSSFRFTPGSKSTVKIDLEALKQKGAFDMKDLWGFEIGTWGPIDLTLYFDNFRVTSEEKVETLNPYRMEAEKIAAPLNINGDLTKPVWNIGTKLEKIIADDSKDTLNEASFGLLWDDNYLYVSADVKDSSLNKDGQYSFDKDAVEIYIDGTYNKRKNYDEHDIQLIVVYDCSEVAVGGSTATEFDTSKVICKSKVTDKGYTMEVAIPWSELDVVPKTDMKIGFDMFNDDNDKDSEVQNVLGWAGTGNNWTNKSSFGEVTLVDKIPDEKPDENPDEKPDEGVKIVSDRLSGDNRFKTSKAIAEKFAPGPVDSVVITTGFTFPDALSGAPLAKNLNAPILLAGNKADNAETLDYIKSHLNKDGTVYILGGKKAISDDLVSQINALGYKKIKRLSGDNRYDTSKAIAEELNVKEGTPVIITTGGDFADALSISSIAAAKGYPILLAENDKLPAQTMAMLNKIKPEQVYIVGGEKVVSQKAKNNIKSASGLDDSKIVRLWGQDRYETGLNIAKHFNLEGDTCFIATGTDFPDALTGSVLAAKDNAPIILVNKQAANQKAYIDSKKYSKLILLGGEKAISKDVEKSLIGK